MPSVRFTISLYPRAVSQMVGYRPCRERVYRLAELDLDKHAQARNGVTRGSAPIKRVGIPVLHVVRSDAFVGWRTRGRTVTLPHSEI
jgi:hypothetical protein